MTFELGTHCFTYIHLVYAAPEVRRRIDSFCTALLAYQPGRTTMISGLDSAPDRGLQVVRNDYERMGVGRGSNPSFRLTTVNEHFKVTMATFCKHPIY